MQILAFVGREALHCGKMAAHEQAEQMAQEQEKQRPTRGRKIGGAKAVAWR